MKALVIAGMVMANGAWAGEGHSHSHGSGPSHSHGGAAHSHGAAIDEGQAKVRAQEELLRLIKKGKLDASWAKSEFVSSEKKMFQGKEEWLVMYKNEASDKKSLYVFLSPSGKFIAANHSGK